MVRHKLMQEGPDAHPSRHFHNGSVKWEGREPIPVTHYHQILTLMGTATDFQRDEEGWISAEINWVESDYDKVDWDFGVHVDPVQYYYGRKQMLHITECWITVVLVAPSPAIPHGMIPDKKDL